LKQPELREISSYFLSVPNNQCRQSLAYWTCLTCSYDGPTKMFSCQHIEVNFNNIPYSRVRCQDRNAHYKSCSPSCRFRTAYVDGQFTKKKSGLSRQDKRKKVQHQPILEPPISCSTSEMKCIFTTHSNSPHPAPICCIR
jgi:hypothetical protein